MADERSATLPLLVSLGLVLLALLVTVVGGGLGRGSIVGALLAAAAAVPAGYVAWLGTQAQTQRKLLYGMLLMLVGLGLAGLLLLLRILSWLR